MSSKTELVSVPRKLLDIAVNGYVQAQGHAVNELRELLLNTPPSDATHYWPRCPDKKRQWRRLEDGWWCECCGFEWLRLDGAMEEEYLPIAAPAEDVSAVVATAVLPELTSDLREILGRPNFTCHFIAKALRLMGFDIPQKSEEEQAATIYWMLGHYLRDPVNWRDAASAELKAGAAAQPAQQ